MGKASMVVSYFLRVVALLAAVLAAILMATAHDTAEILTLKFEAKYTYSPSFEYFVAVYSVVSCYTLIALFLPKKALLWRLLLILDTVVTILLASSFSAAFAIAYVGKKGNSHAGWLSICDQVPKFCRGATGALISGIVAVVVYFLIVVHPLYGALRPLFSSKDSR